MYLILWYSEVTIKAGKYLRWVVRSHVWKEGEALTIMQTGKWRKQLKEMQKRQLLSYCNRPNTCKIYYWWAHQKLKTKRWKTNCESINIGQLMTTKRKWNCTLIKEIEFIGKKRSLRLSYRNQQRRFKKVGTLKVALKRNCRIESPSENMTVKHHMDWRSEIVRSWTFKDCLVAVQVNPMNTTVKPHMDWRSEIVR